MHAGRYYELLLSRQLPIIIDDPRLGELVARLGFSALPFDSYDFQVPREVPVLALLTRLPEFGRMIAGWQTSANLVMHLAAARFDSEPATVEYMLTQLLSLDFAAILLRRAEYLEQVLSCGQIEILTSAGALTCTLQSELEIPSPGDTLERAWLYSIAEFLEASVVNLEGERSSFCVDGDFAFEGLIHLSNDQEVKDRLGGAWDRLGRLAAGGRNQITWRDNRIERLVLGGADVTATLNELLVGAERGSAATELGIGCAEFPQAPDWSKNALLNKSAHGAYVGIGQGWQRPHVDFIASQARCRFVPPESID